ncbi:hypothetical protein E4U43_002326 [Claviceps pusilla]|uniref:Bromo domain-containing protein n=1 Tax=Claviceps pusilla TaxID=123648 RepID=A0A9P7N6T5_9HYPO|nr:hypothetical protein E4U43_002326 [Claviceps pusilla]
MNNPAAYTPLESLFLFQSLVTQGLDTEAFARISESLRNNALVTSDKSFDAARLAPDALQQLFLSLLRDEVQGETGRAETTATATTDGSASALISTSASASSSSSSSSVAPASASPASRKRKLGRPPLPSLREAYEHIDKVPLLLDRLYARYRDTVVRHIREDERQLSSIQREITVLEKSEKERLAKAAAIQNSNGTTSLAPRDGTPGLTPQNVPGQLPSATGSHQNAAAATTAAAAAAAQAGGNIIKRSPPSTTTPVYPPKPLSKQPATSQSAVAPPSLLPSATTPLRPAASPKPEPAAGSGLQAPVGMTQAASRAAHQQTASRSPRSSNPSRPEAIPIASKPKDATPVPAPAPPPPPPQQQQPLGASSAVSGGGIKWEKPYQPNPTTQTPGTPGQTQQAIVATATSEASRPGQPQWSPQLASTPNRTIPGKPVLAAPQNTGQQAPSPLHSTPVRTAGTTGLQSQQQHPRPISTTPVAPPVVRPILQPQSQQQQQQQQQQPLHAQHSSRPVAVAQQILHKNAAGPNTPSQKWAPAQQAAQPRPSPTGSPVPSSAQKDKPYAPPYSTQPPKPAIPEHIIRQAAAAAAAATSSSSAATNALTPSTKKLSHVTAAPSTPGASTPIALTRGFGTKWVSHSTPSTPRPIAAEPESPAYEPVSPPPRATSILSDTPRTGTKRDAKDAKLDGATRTDGALSKTRMRPSRTTHRGRGPSTTPSVSGTTRRSMSIASQADELSMDHQHQQQQQQQQQHPATTTKIKHEVVTPRHIEETGDTTADESLPGGRTALATPGSVSSLRIAKRKRQDSPPPAPSGPPTHVLWTRGFTKVSSSALDQISSHRDANMFATGVRERDAPNYRQIVLQPQDITSIRSAIKQGNKAALQAASSLPGGDPGTASVWLPMSEDLVPPRGIINSAQLERELVHMFCNAIMYNPDPDRGPGPSFLKRNQNEEEEVVGYRLDENGVVKNTRSMFVEVEKLLGDLRSAEKERGAPPPAASVSSAAGGGGGGLGRQTSVATPADDTAEDEDELAGDGNTTASVVKRRRISTRN